MFSRDSSLMTSSVTVLVLPSVIVLLISRVTVSSETVFFSCPSALTSVLLTCSVKDSVRVSVNGFGISLLPQFLRNLIWGSLHAPAVFFLASAIVMAPLSEIKRGLFLTPKAINSESPISFFSSLHTSNRNIPNKKAKSVRAFKKLLSVFDDFNSVTIYGRAFLPMR